MPISRHLFVFLSKRRDRAKILTFQRRGFVLWYMRLERGRFKPVSSSTIGQVELDDTELTMLLDGIDLRRVPRIQHWEPKKVVQGIDTAACP